mgnify:CR=1 FL=1
MRVPRHLDSSGVSDVAVGAWHHLYCPEPTIGRKPAYFLGFILKYVLGVRNGSAADTGYRSEVGPWTAI